VKSGCEMGLGSDLQTTIRRLSGVSAFSGNCRNGPQELIFQRFLKVSLYDTEYNIKQVYYFYKIEKESVDKNLTFYSFFKRLSKENISLK